MSLPRRRILFLDAYDSFSNNITALLATILDVDVCVLPIDAELVQSSSEQDLRRAFWHEASHYDAVVCGPGPGSPDQVADVGLIRHVWSPDEADEDKHGATTPALGICLGFQSLAIACGARVRRLRRGLHGMVRDIAHRSDGTASENIFLNVGNFRATLYHSLCIDIGQDEIPEAEWAQEDSKWLIPERCPDMLPLAWVEEDRGGDEAGVERTLMAMRHRTKPFWGLQYHPESVCTQSESNKVIVNWFKAALEWNKRHGRVINHGDDRVASNAVRPSLLSLIRLGDPATASTSTEGWRRNYGTDSNFAAKTIPLPGHVQIPDIVDVVEPEASERIILDSANATSGAARADVRGRFSIIALAVQESLRIEYRSGARHANVQLGRSRVLPANLSWEIPLKEYGGIWGYLADFHQKRRVHPKEGPESPFLGGFMGFVTYEMGLHGIDIALPQDRGHARPDICLAWITKSIVVDHVKRLVHIQHLRPSTSSDDLWTETVESKLLSSDVWQPSYCQEKLKPSGPTSDLIMQRRLSKSGLAIKTPGIAEYEEKVKQCQEFIAAGDSYELCFTGQTTIVLPRSVALISPAQGDGMPSASPSQRSRRRSLGRCRGSSHWTLFKTLRLRQPAPFASFIRLGGATLVSASPERFLQYDRDGTCSMRPMKGTVRKIDPETGIARTMAQAEAILHVPKEEAENLMIVDLVRHDLHGICGPGGVSVPDLLKVEEYESVFQMITVVEGRLPASSSTADRDIGDSAKDPSRNSSYTGLDVLAASLPPGSMTGAPKKRSCEILRQIEQGTERSLYSGVVGYMCVTGSGDWSVTIRSMFRWDDEVVDAADGADPQEVWHIGAGGAVTILSTPEGEREEMFTKLAGPLGVFAEAC